MTGPQKRPISVTNKHPAAWNSKSLRTTIGVALLCTSVSTGQIFQDLVNRAGVITGFQRVCVFLSASFECRKCTVTSSDSMGRNYSFVAHFGQAGLLLKLLHLRNHHFALPMDSSANRSTIDSVADGSGKPAVTSAERSY